MPRTVAPLLVLFLLTGCGFAPAYRPSAGAAQAQAPAALTDLPVRLVADAALAEVLREQGTDLGLSLLPPGQGADAGPAAVLRVVLEEERYGLRSDRAATRAAVRITGDFLLPGATGGQTAIPVVAVVPYDILRSDYATAIARRDALARAGRQLLEQVRAGILRWRGQRSQKQD